jgi:hypothetical protein
MLIMTALVVERGRTGRTSRSARVSLRAALDVAAIHFSRVLEGAAFG